MIEGAFDQPVIVSFDGYDEGSSALVSLESCSTLKSLSEVFIEKPDTHKNPQIKHMLNGR
jgi:hypothetical protein